MTPSRATSRSYHRVFPMTAGPAAARTTEQIAGRPFNRLGGTVTRSTRCAMSARCADVHAFADGELPEDEAASFREHLAGCRRCQDEFEAIVALRGVVETMGDPPA